MSTTTRKKDFERALKKGFVIQGKGALGEFEYEFVEFLGAGAFGITYRARDLSKDYHPEFTIKEYFPKEGCSRTPNHSLKVDEKSIPAEEWKRRLVEVEEEAKRLEYLNYVKIPGVETFKHVFRENNTIYIVKDFIEGIDLESYLRNRSDVGITESLEIAQKISLIIEEVHKERTIRDKPFHFWHFDIKPSNILIHPEPEQKLYLLDFGSARTTALGEQRLSVSTNSPGYSPPEQYGANKDFGGSGVGKWSDIYSFGAVIYFMLVGQPPTLATKRPQKPENDPVNHAIDRVKGLPREANVLLKRMLDVNSSNRPNAKEIVQILRRILNQEPSTAEDSRSRKTSSPLWSWVVKNKKYFSIAGILAALVSIGRILFLFSSSLPLPAITPFSSPPDSIKATPPTTLPVAVDSLNQHDSLALIELTQDDSLALIEDDLVENTYSASEVISRCHQHDSYGQEEAIRWCTMAADEFGDPRSAYLLSIYLSRAGLTGSNRYLKMAADAGLTEAQTNYGSTCLAISDCACAMQYLQQAAEKRDAIALNLLGEASLKGTCTAQQDLPRALEYFFQSAATGNQEAREVLSDLSLPALELAETYTELEPLLEDFQHRSILSYGQSADDFVFPDRSYVILYRSTPPYSITSFLTPIENGVRLDTYSNQVVDLAQVPSTLNQVWVQFQ